MIMTRPIPAAIPIARIVLQILIALNWLSAVAILTLLLFMPTTRWIMSSLNLSPGAEADRVIFGLRTIAVIGLGAIPLHYLFLKRLLEIVETVGARDPFVAANASRLRTMAWVLLSLQLLGLVVAAIGRVISTPAHPIHLDAGFSINGWLAVLLTFLLAHVFTQGARMREDLEGTV